jgi:hypothetical protein
MRESLRQLENRELRVVRMVNRSRYEPIECREEEAKKALRERIQSLENNYNYYDETEARVQIVGVKGALMQH